MTFRILESVPETFMVQIRQLILNSDFKDSKFKYIVADEYQDYILVDRSHEIYDIVGSHFTRPFKLMILRNPPNCGLGPVHTDGSRFGCLNFPIKVDLDNSAFFTAREGSNPTIRPPHIGEPINKDALRFFYEPEKYLYYNIRKPICISTKVAHGAYNYSDDERILLSLAFPDLESYEDILDQVPKEWL